MGIIADPALLRPATSAPSSTCRSGSCSPPTRRIGLGTLAGGWRIVKTMGMRITKLRPVGRLLRGDRRRDHADRHRGRRHPGHHDPHHHRLDHRRRRDPAALRRALGRGRAHRLGLGTDHPAVRADRRPDLAAPAPRMTEQRRAARPCSDGSPWPPSPLGWPLACLPTRSGSGSAAGSATSAGSRSPAPRRRARQSGARLRRRAVGHELGGSPGASSSTSA